MSAWQEVAAFVLAYPVGSTQYRCHSTSRAIVNQIQSIESDSIGDKSSTTGIIYNISRVNFFKITIRRDYH